MSETAVPALGLSAVTKRFGEVTALDGVSLDLRAGEVHCLLGENGAGKSTLISLLAGMHQPDEGLLTADGATVVLSSPAAALERGIGVVYQHSTLVPTMSVRDNLLLTEAATAGFWLRSRSVRQRLVGFVDLDRPVSALGLAEQQQLEIARVMARTPRVLVLDEPTSMLSEAAITALLAQVRELANRGVAVLLVTHKLREALEVGDRVTVLRRGSVTAQFDLAELRSLGAPAAEQRLITAMFGEGGDRTTSQVSPSRRERPEPGRVILALQHVSTKPQGDGTPITDVTLQVREGEVLGIAGLDGHGQRHLAEVIAGQRAPSVGAITLAGDQLHRHTVRARQALGIRYVTDDRLHEGIVGPFSVRLNLLLKRIGQRPFWRFGRMNRAAVNTEAAALVRQFDIRTPSLEAPTATLSGGNIQKLLLARELAHGPRVVVFHKPSHGLDRSAVSRAHEHIRQFVARGGSAVLITSDLDELLALSTRVAVLSGGRIAGEVANTGEDARARIGQFMAGAQPASVLPVVASEIGGGS